jgi:hypothetical protein
VTAFADLPHEQRLRLRAVLEDAGAYVSAYYGDAVQVAEPLDWQPMHKAARDAGLELVPDSVYWFPLGSDKPPARLRHGLLQYGNRPSFWKHSSWVPTVLP